MTDVVNTIPQHLPDGPNRKCLIDLLIDTLRIARERGEECEHLRSMYCFVAGVATEQGETIDTLRGQVERLREENKRLRGPVTRAA